MKNDILIDNNNNIVLNNNDIVFVESDNINIYALRNIINAYKPTIVENFSFKEFTNLVFRVAMLLELEINELSFDEEIYKTGKLIIRMGVNTINE